VLKQEWNPNFFFNFEVFKKNNMLYTFKLLIVFKLKRISIFNSKYFCNKINKYKWLDIQFLTILQFLWFAVVLNWAFCLPSQAVKCGQPSSHKTINTNCFISYFCKHCNTFNFWCHNLGIPHVGNSDGSLFCP